MIPARGPQTACICKCMCACVCGPRSAKSSERTTSNNCKNRMHIPVAIFVEFSRWFSACMVHLLFNAAGFRLALGRLWMFGIAVRQPTKTSAAEESPSASNLARRLRHCSWHLRGRKFLDATPRKAPPPTN